MIIIFLLSSSVKSFRYLKCQAKTRDTVMEAFYMHLGKNFVSIDPWCMNIQLQVTEHTSNWNEARNRALHDLRSLISSSRSHLLPQCIREIGNSIKVYGSIDRQVFSSRGRVLRSNTYTQDICDLAVSLGLLLLIDFLLCTRWPRPNFHASWTARFSSWKTMALSVRNDFFTKIIQEDFNCLTRSLTRLLMTICFSLFKMRKYYLMVQCFFCDFKKSYLNDNYTIIF